MSSRIEVPVATLADGTCTVVVVPNSLVYGAYAPNQTYLPAVVVSGTSSAFPYTSSSWVQPGPFAAQNVHMINYNVDACMIDFA